MSTALVLARRLNHERTAAHQELWRAVAELDVLAADALAQRIYNLPGDWEASVVGLGALREPELVQRRREIAELDAHGRIGRLVFLTARTK